MAWYKLTHLPQHHVKMCLFSRMSAKLLSPVAPLCGTIDKVVSAVLSISYTAGKKELNGLVQTYVSTSCKNSNKRHIIMLID